MIGILAGHMLGDMVLQNRWLAEIKMTRWYGMLLHCLIVTTTIWLFTQWNIKALAAIFISHYIIDKYKLGKLWPDFAKQGKPFCRERSPFWLGLLADQSFHIATYAIIYKTLI